MKIEKIIKNFIIIGTGVALYIISQITVGHGWIDYRSSVPAIKPRFDTRFCHSLKTNLFLFFLGQNVIHFVSIASYDKGKLEK